MNSSEPATLQPSQPPVGIDLGTTFSVVAYVDDANRPVTISNSVGDLITPSAVFVDDEEVIVGREAVRNAAESPDSYAECLQARHGVAAFSPQDPRHGRSARSPQRLRPGAGEERRPAADRANPESGDHGAGLLRRNPPPRHAGSRPAGGPGSAGHHQRAHGRRLGLRLPARLPESRAAALRPSGSACWSTTSAAGHST